MMFDIAAIGELLIDFTPNGQNEQGIALFARNPGGAPANVLAAAARLGRKTAFIGKVGRDGFGDFLCETLKAAGVDVSGLRVSAEVGTTLAFVQLSKHGDRSFSFYRNPGADMLLKPEEVPTEIVDRCRVLHFGSVSLTDEPSRAATFFAVRRAKEQGRLISYDPNYRPLLWKSAQEAKRVLLDGLCFADIVKVSEEELVFLTGHTDLAEGAKALAAGGASLVLVSMGSKGAYYSKQGAARLLPAYDVRTVDTTGAGDAFMGAVLYCLCGLDRTAIRTMDAAQMDEILAFANACGSLATTKMGAIPSLPSLDEIHSCLKDVPLLRG